MVRTVRGSNARFSTPGLFAKSVAAADTHAVTVYVRQPHVVCRDLRHTTTRARVPTHPRLTQLESDRRRVEEEEEEDKSEEEEEKEKDIASKSVKGSQPATSRLDAMVALAESSLAG